MQLLAQLVKLENSEAEQSKEPTTITVISNIPRPPADRKAPSTPETKPESGGTVADDCDPSAIPPEPAPGTITRRLVQVPGGKEELVDIIPENNPYGVGRRYIPSVLRNPPGAESPPAGCSYLPTGGVSTGIVRHDKPWRRWDTDSPLADQTGE